MSPKGWVFMCVCIAGCTAGDAVELPEVGGTGQSWEEFRKHPPVTWESFRASTAREPFSPYRFIVDGDIVLSDERKLWEHYQAWLMQEYASKGSAGGSALTVRKVLGADVLWPPTQRFDLTYCISESFGARKDAVVAAMDAATRSWSDHAAVSFTHRFDQDRTCTNTNTNVLFNVSPVSASYFAAAFFPDDVRRDRQLLITSAAFTTTEGGRDFQGILRHEIGHILGFRHEHIWLSCTGESTTESRQVTSYDVNSVMHYPQCRPSGAGGYRQTSSDVSGAISLYGSAQPTSKFSVVENVGLATNGVAARCRVGTSVLGGGCRDPNGIDPLRSVSPPNSVVNELHCINENGPISATAICYDPVRLGQVVSMINSGTFSATSNDVAVSCPAGSQVLGGGCQDAFTSTRLKSSMPNTATPGWSCRFENAIGLGVFAYAACVSGSGPAGLELISAPPSGPGNSFTALCSFGKRVIGGGCADTGALLIATAPSSANAWQCKYTSAIAPVSPVAFAICANP